MLTTHGWGSPAIGVQGFGMWGLGLEQIDYLILRSYILLHILLNSDMTNAYNNEWSYVHTYRNIRIEDANESVILESEISDVHCRSELADSLTLSSPIHLETE